MELILIKDIENLGFADDIVKVKPGYGRNYLIPKGLAILATTSEKKQLAEKIKQRVHKEIKLIEDAKSIANKIADLSLKIKVKVGKEGKLFGSVNNDHIATALSDNGISVDKKYVKLSSTVKSIGKYNASIRLHRDVTKDIEFEVISD